MQARPEYVIELAVAYVMQVKLKCKGKNYQSE